LSLFLKDIILEAEILNFGFQSFEDTSFDEAKDISSSTVDGMSGVFVPELQRGGGVHILVEVEYDCDANFRPFYDKSSSVPNKTPSTSVDGKTRGPGVGAAARELPRFQRDGWDAIGDGPTNLALYMCQDQSCKAAPMKIPSRL
jgi:hypothetical protein